MVRSEESLRYWKARFHRPMIATSVVVLLGMCLRVAFAPGSIANLLGEIFASATWLVFLAEWLILLRVAPARGRFLLHHKFLTLIVIIGPIAVIANLVTALPGAIAASTALRLAPLARWLLNRGSLAYLMAFAALVVATATIAFWRVEGTSFGSALYWSTSAVTIGPQGASATTPETMALTVILGFLGIGFFGAVIGTLITTIMQREQSALEAETREGLGEELDELEDLVGDAAEQAEVDNAMLAAKLDVLMANLDARLTALEERLPAADTSPRRD